VSERVRFAIVGFLVGCIVIAVLWYGWLKDLLSW